jgi:hypothetical protein
MNILLIWEEVPERTSAYVIKEPSDELRDILLASHGHYINGGVGIDHPINQLSERWAEFKIDDFKLEDSEPIRGPIDVAIICGFIM